MLNFENISFELLEDSIAKSLKTTTIIETIIIGIAIVAFIAVIFYLVKEKINNDSIDFGDLAYDSVFFGLIVILVAVSTITITSLVSRPYAIANVEVTPTETVTKEFLQQNDNFIEIDGKFYYKKNIISNYWRIKRKC